MHISRASRALAALTVSALTALLVPGAFAQAAEEADHKVLLFTKTAAGAYRHSSMDAAIAAFNQMGAANGIQVDESADSSVFNTTTLNTYDAVVMLQSSGMVWDNDAQRAAAQAYVRSGHGIVAVHNATDMNIESEFPWWDDVVMAGAHMTAHSSIVQGTAKVADKVHPSTAGLPDRWVRSEEWYNFDKNARGDVHVLVTADETTYDAGGARMGADHPISWCRNAEGGKVWATAMGHEAAAYSEPNFLKHLLGGLKWAAGAAAGDCGGTVADRYQKVTLDGAPDQPMQLDVASDGKVFYISRSGKVNVIHTHDGVPETHLAGQLSVYDGGEDGGIGLALDPDFATNRWIYLNHSPTGTAEINRVTRFTIKADDTLDMASAKTVIEVPAYRGSDEPGHTGGSLAFGPGGNLYIGVGDDTNPFASDGYAPIDERAGREKFDAQRSSANTNDLRGKILRVHPKAAGGYTIPAGNLFAPGTVKTRPEIYAMGLRNSFRFAVDPETGWISAADYGPDAGGENANRGPEGTVEWNLIKQPGFYGWPYCVGNNIPFNDYNFATDTSGAKFNCAAPVNNSPNNTGLTTLPAAKPAQVWYDYHASAEFPEIDLAGGAAPMGGPFYHYDAASTSERKFPAYYDKTPFFYEWSRNFVKEFRLDSAGDLLKINPFVAQLGLRAPIDMKFGPDGAMYLAEWGNGYGHSNTDDGIYRIDYVAGNRAPLAKASATPDSGQAPLDVAFSSTGSADPDAGDVLTYTWDFGDGSTGTGPNPAHTYTANGNYTARLTVTDAAGKTGTTNMPIVVGNTRPKVTFTTPGNGRVFSYGDTINYQIAVNDPEDGTIDCSKVVVTAALGHDSHSHDTGQYTGCSGSITTSASGHDATANTYFVLSADYTDNGGLKGTTSATLQPRHKQAEYFTAQSGIRVIDQSGAQNGKRIGDISDGDWIAFKPLNLTGVESATFRVSAPSSTGASIELRAGSPTGTLIATSPVPSTGGWDNYVDLTPVAVTDTAGTQTVYAVFKAPSADSFDLDAITFNAPGTGTPVPTSGNTYTVTSEHSGKRMDVRSASTADGAAVIQYTDNGGSNQRWRLTDVGSGSFTLTAQHSSKCLDLLSKSNVNVQQWTCVAGASDQKWKLQPAGLGAYRIVSLLSGKCLTVPQASTADDIQLTHATCSTAAANQKWRFGQV
ncbi:ThuA domain-containing protein [Streptomyces sp. NBC_00513]|uniref:ThuA domain-containing protein n=1 Tax=unclassified Streptomyces TaxID=2593676 RepID=UPI0022584BE7|nr:ThuA domain-containing protein [Streptomyces sp. NBC_00424]MCX5070981.1 ThuA domain-containing protein [Streptomyces sp. NBC_00424]WUD45583.1 ThuA domain-containing protein [Streptomyces sp. NBC_00513]